VNSSAGPARTGIVATLFDLILLGGCAGCASSAHPLICPGCAAELSVAPEPRRPRPAPDGLPSCVAGGDYDGALREVILAYKEHGRRSLAAPLGDRLGQVVRAGWPTPSLAGPSVSSVPFALVPVPATAAAVRARHGDHMLRLARRAARWLSAVGQPAVVTTPLRALPKADSAALDREQRASSARGAFAVARQWRAGARPAALRAVADSGAVILVDDVLTTGATLAAAATVLLNLGVPVAFAATLAATRLRG
jgi:predicted amidophosphoribosyltransferase